MAATTQTSHTIWTWSFPRQRREPAVQWWVRRSPRRLILRPRPIKFKKDNFSVTNLEVMRRGTTMKKVVFLTIFAALVMISSAAVAQTTASGTLTVTATVNGSIQLVFNSDASGL